MKRGGMIFQQNIYPRKTERIYLNSIEGNRNKLTKKKKKEERETDIGIEKHRSKRFFCLKTS